MNQQLKSVKLTGIAIIFLVFTLPMSAQTTYQHLRETTGNAFVDEYGQQALNTPEVFTDGRSGQLKSERGSWESLGPYGGDVLDIAICPDNPSIVFATAGAPFISNDGGSSWMQLSSLGELSNAITAFAAFPGGKILAGGTNLYGKVAVSADYGETWTTVNLPPNTSGQPVYVIDIEYASPNPDIIFLGGSAAFGATKSEVIYKSTDGGEIFHILNTDVLDPSYPVVNLSIDPMNTNTIFACASGGMAGGAVIVTTDGGSTWVDRSAGLNTAYVINAVSVYNGVGYVAGGQLFGSQNFGVYKTTNAGQNWTSVSSGFPVKAVNEVIISPTNSDVVYAGTEGGGVYESTDAGATWVYNTTGANNFACRRLALNPANAQEILGGFLSMAVFKSTDGGTSWEASNTGIGSMTLNDIAVNIANPDQMIVAFEAQNSGGCFYSNDGGTTWILAETLPATRYSAVAIDVNGILYAWSNGPSTIAQEGLYKSTDGGASWVNKGPNIGSAFETEIWDVEVSNEPADFIIISGNNFGNNGWKGVLYKSNNGGDTWENVFISQLDYDSFQHASIVDVPPYNLAYAAFSSQDGQGGFLKSIDGGNSWTEINSGLQNGVKRATWIVHQYDDPDVLYGLAGANETYFTAYKSVDGGSNWTDLNLHTNAWESLICLAVHPQNTAVIYVGSSVFANAVYITVNGGGSWQLATDNFPYSSPTAFTKMFPYEDGYAFCASTFSASAHKIMAANPEYIAIDGLVTDFSLGTPVGDAMVFLDGDLADYEVTTNPQGTFEIEGFVAGTYTVEVDAEGYNNYFAENVEINEPTTLEIMLTAPVLGADVTAINGGVSPDSYNSTSFNISNTGSGPLEWQSSINFESEYGGVILEMDNLYSQVPAGSGFFGCEFDGENLWIVCTGLTAGFNHYLCKFDITGTLLATYDQNIDVWGLRGIYYHTDGYLYGGSNVGFHRIDPTDGSITLLFEERFGLSCLRGLTYIPVLGGFVARDYDTDFVIFDVEGNYLGSLPKPTGLSATVAGISYDLIHNCIWMYDRSGSAATTFYQYSISEGALTGVVIDVPLFGGLTTQKAGGSFFSSTLVPGKYVLGGVTNSATPQDVLFAVDICPSWMKTIPNYGLLEPGENMEIVVEFDGLGLEDGETLYSTLHLNSSNPNVGTIDIPVTLNVELGIGIDEVETFNGQVSPNPFSNTVNISFNIYEPSWATITIMDINGKEVTKLLNQEVPSGENSISWDGTDDYGVSVPAGVYTLSLKTNTSISYTKLIRAR